MRIVQLVYTVLSWLPLPLVHRLGEMLAYVLRLIRNDLRTTAQTNIRRCFPEWSQTKQEHLVQRCLQETSKAALETGAMWLWPMSRILPLVRDVSGKDVLEREMAKGQGVILAIPHLGAWEMVGLYCSNRWPMTSLYRPPRQSALNDVMREGRERAGAKLVPTVAGGVRALFKALNRGELIAILPDQDPDRASGVFAPFFGIQANTMTLLSRLAGKSGATVLMAYAIRLPNGEGYHLHFEETESALADADAEMAAFYLNQAVERCALRYPAQYQWGYKRFKTRPEGEGRFYQ